MHPNLPFLRRECTKDYPVPGSTNIVIEKGTAIIIPAMALQRDSLYYPEPNHFNPERFVGTCVKAQPYMPFGQGPRICIGQRLGKIQVKVGLMMMLQKNDYFLQDETEQQLKMSPRATVLIPERGINLKVKSRY